MHTAAESCFRAGRSGTAREVKVRRGPRAGMTAGSAVCAILYHAPVSPRFAMDRTG